MTEFFDVVDDEDNVVGRANRAECHERKLTHRSVMFFVFDENDRVFVNKRAGDKEFFGGRYSIVFGGHVPAGETYDEAVVRELAEETGLTDKPTRLSYFKKRLPEENENVTVYGVAASRPLKLLESEVVSGEYMTPDEIKKAIKTKDFIPETMQLMPILRKHLKLQE